MTEQELMMKHQKRRDRIKNIAILFLTIMLLLTFFSNTIMNYSLAEVGTAYASHGPLTTKIRGDGYVEAKDPIQVTTDKESEVLKVFVKDGDKVKKGQTLFLLEGTTVDELKQAQTDLMNLNYEYAKSLLEITVPNYDENNLEIKYAQKDLRKALKAIEDTREDIQKKKGEYKELKQKMKAAKKEMDKKADAVADKASEVEKTQNLLDEYNNEKTELTGENDGSDNEDIQAKRAAKTEATRIKEDAEAALEEAKEVQQKYEITADRTRSVIEKEIKEKQEELVTLQETKTELYNDWADAKNAKGESKATIKQLRQQIEDIRDEIGTVTSAAIVNKLQAEIIEKQNEINEAIENDIETVTKNINSNEKSIRKVNQAIADCQSELLSLESKEKMLDAAKKQVENCQAALKTAEKNEKTATRALEDAENAFKQTNSKELSVKLEALEAKIKTTRTQKIQLDNQKTKLDADYTEVQEAYNTAKAAVDSFQKVDENAMDTVNQAADEKRKALEALYNTLSKTQADNSLTQQKSDLDSQQKQEEIKRKKKEIARLKKKKLPVKLKAKQAGVVGSVTIKVGEKTTANTPLAEITVKKNGFKLSIPVTMDQSKQVKRGDNASVLNIWDGDVKAILSEIKTDPSNPNAGRTLVFDVSGDVENGTSLSISIGERTANYDLIVPTSAIREDSDGKFILRIEEKSSPVGNRYIARKEAVTIITQDETQSAVTASFDSYTSIITTSSKSVEPGDYVRLAS